MAAYREASPDQAALLDALIASGLLIASGVPGVYGRSSAFEDIRRRFEDRVIRAAAQDGAEQLRFPPLIPRAQLESNGYLRSFPHLAGTVFGFEGDEREALQLQEQAARHEDWSASQTMSELALSPAACYPVYPAIAARGALAPAGITVDLAGSYVFRHEPSGDPARLQMFHQHEIVRIGAPEVVSAWRDLWRDRALELLRGLGLDAHPNVATDPFFGRSGRMLAANQRAQALKFELQVPIAAPEPTAVASFNYHQEHFATTYGITLNSGESAHTACLGFGQERIVIALLSTHGFDAGAWPDAVRAELWPV